MSASTSGPTARSAPAAPRPALSIQPWNFAAEDPGPGGWQRLLEQGRAADAAGVDRLVVSDHVVMGEQLEAYGDPRSGGIEGGVQPTGPDGHWLEPLTLLSAWAVTTTRTRLMTGILIAGLRRPATLAKQTATLDVLSGGRLDLGVGVGWQREEYTANGLPFAGRGAHLDETLAVCRALWRERAARYTSASIAFEGIHCMPKPLQPDGVPLWISGRLNANVLRRIARFGSGWIPWGEDAVQPERGLVRIREQLEAVGRDPTGFHVTAALPLAMRPDRSVDWPATMAPVPGRAEAGITDFRLPLRLAAERAAVEDQLAPAVEAFRVALR